LRVAFIGVVITYFRVHIMWGVVRLIFVKLMIAVKRSVC
jgi:hypothetical protein